MCRGNIVCKEDGAEFAVPRKNEGLVRREMT